MKTIGALLLPQRQQIAIAELRRQTADAASELATGRVAEVGSHLRGSLTPLAQIESQLVRMESQNRLLQGHALRLDSAQSALVRVAQASQGFVVAAEAKAGLDQTRLPPFDVSALARSALEDTIAALSVSAGGQRVFGGIASDRPPLAAAAEMLAALPPVVAGLSDPGDIAAAIRNFFEAPGGGFDSQLYRGGPPGAATALGDGQAVPPPPTAAEPALRRQLAALAMAAAAGDPALGLSAQGARQLFETGTNLARENTGQLAVLQGRVGQAQSSVARAQENAQIDRDGAMTARNALVGADPFVAANRLEQGRVQLESVYAVTARLSGLSLVRFLS